MDETTQQIDGLQAALQEKDARIAEVTEQMRVAVLAAQTKAQEEVQQVEQRLQEQMATAVEQSRAELDEAMSVVARVQQHAQDWIAEAEVSTAAQIQDVQRRAQAFCAVRAWSYPAIWTRRTGVIPTSTVVVLALALTPLELYKSPTPDCIDSL